MKHTTWEYMMYYLQLTAAGVFLLILCAYYIHTEEQDFLGRGMYSEHVKGIQLSNEYLVHVCGEEVKFQMPVLKEKEDFMIYKRLAEDYNEIVRGIYGTKDVFSFEDYLEQGRFFTSEDYEKRIPAAVIGSGIVDQTYVEDGKRYYGYKNQLYEVIGIFQETGSKLDYTVYLNLTHLLLHMEHYGLYYIDASDTNTIDLVWNWIEEHANGRYSISEVIYEAEEGFGLNQMNQMLLMSALAAILLNLIVTGMFFVTRKRYVIAIQKLCGMTQKELLWEYGKRIFLVVLSAIGSIAVIQAVLAGQGGVFTDWNRLGWQHYGLLFGGMGIMGILLVHYAVSQIQNMDIGSILKGR